MILASGEGQLVFLVLMAIFGLISWITGTLNPADKHTPQSPSGPGTGSTPPRRPNADSEEERMRRFLEALGVPTGETTSPPRPAPQPRVEQRPVPPALPRRPLRPTPPPVEPQWHPTSLDELPAPSARVERIVLPELATPQIPEFDTVASKIAAAPAHFPGTGDEGGRPTGPTLSETLRAALASPQQLRSAFVLSEVFGPPPGLR
jgi:hypothetical protein